MTGAGAPGAPGILKCLQANPTIHITMADADPNALGKYIHAEFEQIPRGDDPSLAQQLLSICKKRKINVVLPLVTRELIPLAKNKLQFEKEGIHVLISDAETLEIANNKTALYQFMDWRGMKVPAFRVAENLSQFENAVEELGYPNKTVCFKPSVSNGSRGFRIIDPHAKEFDLLFNEKPTARYISFDDAKRILKNGFPELLVTEYLEGPEYSVDCLCNHGNPVLVIPRIRNKIVNGISAAGEFVNNQGIIQYCKEIITSLKLHGNIGIQVKENEEGQPLILEINPRVQGTIVAALGAGVNLPVLAIKQELKQNIQQGEMEVQWGTKFQRYWNEVFYV